MEPFFDPIHASAASELAGIPHGLADTEEMETLRQQDTPQSLSLLAELLHRQLRYRDAIAVYDRLIALQPEETVHYRQRAAKYLATLQPEKAVADFRYCLSRGGDRPDLLYRMGIALYLAGDWDAAMAAQAEAYPQFTAEMGIAAMYWHSMSAYRAGVDSQLLPLYRRDMEVGHHTAYRFAVETAVGLRSLPEALEALEGERSDLEYSMMAYGVSLTAGQQGQESLARKLLSSVVQRDGFWISYSYLAAWQDTHRGEPGN